MRERVQHRQIEKENRQSFRLAMGHLNPRRDYAHDVLFDSQVSVRIFHFSPSIQRLRLTEHVTPRATAATSYRYGRSGFERWVVSKHSIQGRRPPPRPAKAWRRQIQHANDGDVGGVVYIPSGADPAYRRRTQARRRSTRGACPHHQARRGIGNRV